MLEILIYHDDFSKSQGLNQLWCMDSSTEAETENTGFAARHGKIIPKPANKGAFSFTIPLRHIFGFSDDYDKIVHELKHALSLVRVIQTPMPCTEPPQSTMWQKIF